MNKDSQTKLLIVVLLAIVLSFAMILTGHAQNTQGTIPKDTAYRYYGKYQIHQYYPKVYKEKYPEVNLFFGGGFCWGSWKQLTAWKDTFIAHGYAVSLCDYQVSPPFPTRNGAEKGIQCGMCAVRFEKKFANKMRLDTSLFYTAGKSAGSFIAIGIPYMINSDFNPSNVISLYSDQSNSVAAVCNFSGAIFDLSWLQRSNTPVLNIWGDLDTTVPPSTGKSFGIACSGGKAIYNVMTTLGHKTEAYDCNTCKHCLLPSTPVDEFNSRINYSLDLMIQFFK